MSPIRTSIILKMAILFAMLILAIDAQAQAFGDEVAKCLADKGADPQNLRPADITACEKQVQRRRPDEKVPAERQSLLLKPAIAFLNCAEMHARTEFAAAITMKHKIDASDEGRVWNSVLDECFMVLGSEENTAMVYQHYRGNEREIKAYRDGVLWTGRAFVINLAIDFSRYDEQKK